MSTETNNKSCCIFGAAPITSPLPPIPENSLVIAADGGLNTVRGLGITPDIVLGDFDSLGEIPNVSCELIRHPIEKDDTDTGLAVKTGLERGCVRFFIFGGMGGDRYDHTLANLQTLVHIAKSGAVGFLTDGKRCFTAISGDSELIFPRGYTGDISVFSAEGIADGVNIEGLYYSVSNGSLSGNFPLGVSNSFPKATTPDVNSNSNQVAKISVKSGSLWIYFNCEEKALSEYPQTR